MPTQTAIAPSSTPQVVEQPIPTRTVNTRFSPPAPKIAGQPISDSSPVADSTEPEDSVRLSPQLTALARKEQAFRQREQALKDQEQEMESMRLEAEQFRALKSRMGNKDFSAAEEMGLSYEDYTTFQLNKQGDVDPQAQAVSELKAELEAMKRGQEESAAQQYEETVAEYRKEISRSITDNEEYSSIKHLEDIAGIKGEDAVMQLILDAFEEGEELTVDEACGQVESYVYEQAQKYTALPKFKKDPIIEEAPQRALPRPTIGKTLTNDMTVGSETRPQKSLQHLSEADRYAEARRRVMERQQKG